MCVCPQAEKDDKEAYEEADEEDDEEADEEDDEEADEEADEEVRAPSPAVIAMHCPSSSTMVSVSVVVAGVK